MTDLVGLPGGRPAMLAMCQGGNKRDRRRHGGPACSVVASVGVPNRVLYSASKAVVAAITLAMAADHLTEGIRVNAVTPGTTDTHWVGAC